MKPLVMSAFCNYPASAADPFVQSLLKTGYGGDHVVYKWEHTPDIVDPIDLYRLRIFKQHLEQETEDREFVMISDLRDVEFQSDPSKIEHSQLDCYLEDDKWTLKSEPYNRDWILRVGGMKGLHAIGDKPISCSGIMIGTKHGILHYLTELLNFADEYKHYWWGIHQAAHNWLIYNGKIQTRLIHNEESEVYTVGLIPITIYQHKVYNGAGKIPAIVHQHDRHVKTL